MGKPLKMLAFWSVCAWSLLAVCTVTAWECEPAVLIVMVCVWAPADLVE